MTPAEARALIRQRRTATLCRRKSKAALAAKAEARARRILELAEAGTPVEEMAAELGIKPISVGPAIRAAKIRLASDV